MPKTSTKSLTPDQIADMADQGQDISSHFTNQFTVVAPTSQRVNTDLTAPPHPGILPRLKRIQRPSPKEQTQDGTP